MELRDGLGAGPSDFAQRGGRVLIAASFAADPQPGDLRRERVAFSSWDRSRLRRRRG